MAIDKRVFENGTAASITAAINGQSLIGKPKLFSTGSVGWNITGKVLVEVDGVMQQVQVSGNAIICKSK